MDDSTKRRSFPGRGTRIVYRDDDQLTRCQGRGHVMSYKHSSLPRRIARVPEARKPWMWADTGHRGYGDVLRKSL
jgi:hypothetical protein